MEDSDINDGNPDTAVSSLSEKTFSKVTETTAENTQAGQKTTNSSPLQVY